MDLSSEDLPRLFEAMQHLYTLEGLDGFPHRVLRALRQLVGAEMITYSEVDLTRKRMVETMDPLEAHRPEFNDVIAGMKEQHPLMVHYERTRDGRAYKISDFVSEREFRNTALYQDVYRIYGGIQEQMCIALPAPPELMVTTVLSRPRRTFTERDRTILDMLRPHLITAYRNAQAVAALEETAGSLTRVLDAHDRAILVIGSDGRERLRSRLAERWLEAYFPGCRRDGTGLPDPVERWLRRSLAPADVPPVRSPLVIAGPGRCLVLRLVDDPETESRLIVMDERIGLGAAVEQDLPPRLRQVLELLRAGQSEKQVASTLDLSRHTVHEYVNGLYRRFGVNSRGELLACFISSAR